LNTQQNGKRKKKKKKMAFFHNHQPLSITRKTTKLEPIPEEINNRMRELASLSVLITPDLQIAPHERQSARHKHIANKPVREQHPMLSPMEQRLRETARKKEIEAQRDQLRDQIVKELQDKYLNGDPSLLFPERNKHNEMHNIQFPMKPFLPVEISDEGDGLKNFPPQLPEKTRSKKRFPEVERKGEMKTVFAEPTPEQFASERSLGEQMEMKARMITWQRRQHQKTTRAVPSSIFEQNFNNLRSGASSIETKRGISKNSSLLPLSGMNASEATMLGPNAPFGTGRAVIYQRAPHVLQEKEQNFARQRQQAEATSQSTARTEYQRLMNDTANIARAKELPVRGEYFRPPVVAPRNREVITHDADVVFSSPRKLPVPPDSMRRVQLFSTY
jgi:hypothetical protein